MKKIFLIKILIYFIFFASFESIAKINNKIVAKIGNEIITAVDVENEIKIMIILNQKEFTQNNVNQFKNVAVQSLVRKLIKKNEIVKYKITEYNSNDLDNLLLKISKSFNTNKKGLKNILEKNYINYENFVDKFRTNLLWNTLIYSIYKNQITINTVEIENELRKRLLDENEIIKYKLSEIEIAYNQDSNKILDNIYYTIKKDGFENAAKKYSISPSSLDGGQIGWFFEKSLSKTYLNELKKLSIGNTTNPIRNLDSLIILKIENIKTEKNNKNYDLEKIKKQIVDQKKKEKLELFSKSHYSNLESLTLIEFK
jgi:peptidyl-prolyl cis-trans isomerase SurA